jgi:hypothetical protein
LLEQSAEGLNNQDKTLKVELRVCDLGKLLRPAFHTDNSKVLEGLLVQPLICSPFRTASAVAYNKIGTIQRRLGKFALLPLLALY